MKIYTHPYIPRLYGINTITSQEEIKTKNTKLKRPTLKIKSKTSVSNVIGSKNFPKNHSSIDIILEIVQGFSLEVLVKQKKLTDIEKIIILLDLSNVLEYLHGMLLIHRDLKPANIMIDKEFKLKLLDFGISKVEKDRNGVYTSVIFILKRVKILMMKKKKTVYKLLILLRKLMCGHLDVLFMNYSLG